MSVVGGGCCATTGMNRRARQAARPERRSRPVYLYPHTSRSATRSLKLSSTVVSRRLKTRSFRHFQTRQSSMMMMSSQMHVLHQYVLDTTVLPHEPECMRELRLVTDKHEMGFMQSSPDEAQLLRMLIKLTGAKNTLEVGYSLLATALALPDDGKVIAMDVDRSYYYEVGRPYIEKAGVAE